MQPPEGTTKDFHTQKNFTAHNNILLALSHLNHVKLKVVKNYNAWLRYSSYTLQLLVMIGISVWGGIKLDEKLKISPLLTISLPLLVLGVTFYKLIRDTTKKQNIDKKRNR